MQIAPDELPPEISRCEFSQSPSIAKLGAALAKAQGLIGHAKADAVNPHFKSTYADLAAIVDAVGPHLSACEIARYQAPLSSRDGEIGVLTMLIHEGEWLACTLWCKPASFTPQAIGTVISYLRRYALAAVTGVAQVDDDGNLGSGKGTPPPVATPSPAQQAAAAKAKDKARAKPGPDDVTPRPTPPPVVGPESVPPAPVAPGVPPAVIPAGEAPVYSLRGGKWDATGFEPAVTEQNRGRAKGLQKELGISEAEWTAKLTVYYGKTSSTQLTDREALELIERLTRRKGVQLPA